MKFFMILTFSLVLIISLVVASKAQRKYNISTLTPQTTNYKAPFFDNFSFKFPDTSFLTKESFDLLKTITESVKYLSVNYNQYIIQHPDVALKYFVKFYCSNPTTGLKTETAINDPDFSTKIDCSKKIAFIIHGWTGSGNGEWLSSMIEKLTTIHNINACAVDWGSMSITEYMMASFIGTRITSDAITSFIKTLIAKRCTVVTNIELIGHSLGAHIAGYVGQEFEGEIPVIYGLDPAGPRFSYTIVVDPYWRLDPTDAKLVVAIHSCDPIMGVTIRVGHQEIYINKGEWIHQKGCNPLNFVDAYYKESFICAHYRAVQLMDFSINPANNGVCRMIGCKSMSQYDAKACKGGFETFGYNTQGTHGTFYIAVDEKPVCINKTYLD